MNIFQVVVIGTLVILFGGSGYYFIKADSHGILSQSITGNKLEPSQQRMLELTGAYTCTQATGCKDSYNLNLSEDGKFGMTIFYADGVETLVEKGDWKIIEKGYIRLTVIGNQLVEYNIPKTILIKSVGTSALSNLVYSDKQYNNMKNPVFSKAVE